MNTNFKSPTARGGIYPLVLIVCAAGAAAALTGLTIRQATDNRAAASGDLTNARLLARSGIESALQVIDEKNKWRSKFGAEKTWSSTLDPGTISIRISDETDGDLSDDPNDPYTITSVGNIGSTKAALSVTVSPALSAYRQKVIDAGPIRYWPLDETSGFTAQDLTGNNTASHTNPAALNAMTGYDGLPASLMDSFMDFSWETHTDDYLLGAGTIMCWVYCVANVGGDQTIIAKTRKAGKEGDFLLTLNRASLDIKATITDDLGNKATLNMGQLKPQTWTHIAVAFGSGGLEGFVNGAEIDTVSNARTDWTKNTHNFQFGAAWTSLVATDSLNGSVRDVAIFDYAFDWKTIPPLLDDTVLFEIDPESWAWIID